MWIDLGHANPAGALKLWEQIRNEQGAPHDEDYREVRYHQMMGNKHIKIGIERSYAVKAGLNLQEKQSVALSIFLDVSYEFEKLQSNWILGRITNSGFSAEDLVSNLIGFYRAIKPELPLNLLCEPVSKEVALKVWDIYGAVGTHKNHRPTPYLYPTPGTSLSGPVSALLPAELDTLKPAPQGSLFYPLN